MNEELKSSCGVLEEKNNIIKPNYYNDTKITPFDYIKANNLDFFEGNVLKYLTRWRKKNGLEDLRKAMTYLQELIKEAERKEK